MDLRDKSLPLPGYWAVDHFVRFGKLGLLSLWYKRVILEQEQIFVMIVTCGPMEGIQKAGRWRFLLSVAVLLTLL